MKVGRLAEGSLCWERVCLIGEALAIRRATEIRCFLPTFLGCAAHICARRVSDVTRGVALRRGLRKPARSKVGLCPEIPGARGGIASRLDGQDPPADGVADQVPLCSQSELAQQVGPMALGVSRGPTAVIIFATHPGMPP